MLFVHLGCHVKKYWGGDWGVAVRCESEGKTVAEESTYNDLGHKEALY